MSLRSFTGLFLCNGLRRKTPIATSRPSWTTDPSITGTLNVGQTLTGSDGVIVDGTVSARQWLRDGFAISGATTSTYALVAADLGANIRFKVTATNAAGAKSALSSAVGPIAPATLQPSGTWNGTAGTGFSSTPTDPTRTTAKPAAHFLDPPKQSFTDSLLVGVMAFANNGGTLAGGIEKVRFHFEGSAHDVSQVTLRHHTRYDGSTYQVPGYYINLAKPSGTAGTAHLYAEIFPADGTMQNRVIGPFIVNPVASLYEYELTVEPSQTVIAGSRYQSITAALAYLQGQAAERAHISIDEAGTYDIGSGVTYGGGNGRVTIEATAAVTIGKSSYTTDANATLRPKYGNLHFKGSNITFDATNISQVRAESAGEEYWFEGVKIEIADAAKRAFLWRKGPRPVSHFFRDGGYFTDCDIRDINDPIYEAQLARGNIVSGGYRDIATHALAVVANTVTDHTAKEDWATDVNALTITGPANSTFSRSGGSDASSNTFTAKESAVSVGTFTVGNGEAYYTGASGDGYTVQDVADWINTLTGWSATVLDDARRASALSVPGTKGAAFTDIDVTSATTFSTYFDQHGDFYQHSIGGPEENVIVWGNVGSGMWTQNLFFKESTSGNMQDIMLVNNAFDQVRDAANLNKSQFGDNQSHVCTVHNTLSTQEIVLIQSGSSTYSGDSYCLFANNAAEDFTRDAALTGPTIKNNVLDSGAVGSGDTGEVKVGDESTKFADALNGDFTPAGGLLSNLKTPVVSQDKDGAARAFPDAVGAIKI